MSREQNRKIVEARIELVESAALRSLSAITYPDSFEAIVGIPFHSERDTLPGVVRVAKQGLEDAGYSYRSAVKPFATVDLFASPEANLLFS